MIPKWWSVERDGDFAQVSIVGEVAGFSWPADGLLRELDGVTRADVLINSLGGSTPDALAVHARLMEMRECTVHVQNAGSAAVLVMLAGRKITISDTGSVLLHSPVDFVAGPPKELRRRAAALEGLIERAAQIIAQRTKQPASTVRGWLRSGDHWFNPTEAKAAGLVDAIVPDPPKRVLSTPESITLAGPTQDESLFLDLLKAFPTLPVQNRDRFARNVNSWLAYNVKEVSL